MRDLGTVDLLHLDLLDVGNTIQLYGAIYSGRGKIFLLPLPDEEESELHDLPVEVLRMSVSEWERFLQQSDVLDILGPNKAILRKSQRQVDSSIS